MAQRLITQSVLIVPAALGRIHRQVGNVDQPVHARCMVGEYGHAQAGADVALVVADGDGRGEFDEDFLTDAAGFVLQAAALRQSLENDHEFIAADAGNGVGRTQDLLEAGRGGHQYAVAGGVSIVVVDGLEAIEVDEHQRHPRVVDPRLFQRFGQTFFEHQPVGQSRQWVKVRQVAQVTGGSLFFGDVAHHAHHLDRFVVLVLHHVAGLAQPAEGAVGPDHTIFLVVILTGFQATQLAGPDPGPVIRVHAGAEQGVGGGHFADLEPEHAVDRVRPVEPVGIDLPVPGADAGKVLAAFETLRVAFLVDMLSFAEVVDQCAAFAQLLAERALAPEQHDDQREYYQAKGSVGREQNHSGVAIMAMRTVRGGSVILVQDTSANSFRPRA